MTLLAAAVNPGQGAARGHEPGNRTRSQDTRGPDAPFPRGRTLTHIPCRHDYASRTMPERRILETTQLLGALPPDTLEALRRQSTMRTVARNEVLFRQGEDSSELYGIVNGRIAILTRSPDGRESLADAVVLDVPARTAKRLLEIAGDADQFRLPMTQEDLAGLVGASRERVNLASDSAVSSAPLDCSRRIRFAARGSP